MLKGMINCTCGQLMYFETAADFVECPACKAFYKAADHADPEPELIEETEEAPNA